VSGHLLHQHGGARQTLLTCGPLHPPPPASPGCQRAAPRPRTTAGTEYEGWEGRCVARSSRSRPKQNKLLAQVFIICPLPHTSKHHRHRHRQPLPHTNHCRTWRKLIAMAEFTLCMGESPACTDAAAHMATGLACGQSCAACTLDAAGSKEMDG